MCFGPVASFTASGFLASIGVLIIRNVRARKELFFAAFPALFAVQQFIEGLIWVELKNGRTEGALMNGLTFSFLLFAYGLWPILCPLSVYAIEYNPRRRKILRFLTYLGILTSCYLLIFIIINPFDTLIAGCGSVRYQTFVPLGEKFTLIYIAATLLPYFVSSQRIILVFGIPNVIFCVVAYFTYEHAFISTWCFFAALISANLYIFLKKLHHEPVLPVKI